MKSDEVPQHNSHLFDGHSKVVYAVDEQGRYERVETSGWRAEETATELAIAEFERELAAVRKRCATGSCAPLEYHMVARRMDVATLADSTGLAKWRVRRHLRPKVFARLPDRLIQRYVQALQLSAGELRQLPQPGNQ